MVMMVLRHGELNCGKRLSKYFISLYSSKKKCFWAFKVDSTQYKFELICSFLSGKKRVLLNGEEIHSEKKYQWEPLSLLNINFDFVHNIGYDCVRITQNKQQFEWRINNRPFSDLTETSKPILIQDSAIPFPLPILESL
jgi:hypothetical protein